MTSMTPYLLKIAASDPHHRPVFAGFLDFLRTKKKFKWTPIPTQIHLRWSEKLEFSIWHLLAPNSRISDFAGPNS